VLAQTTGFADIRDKSEIEQSDAIDTEYKISLSALLGRTDEDHFLLPDSAGTVATAITAKFFTLRRVAIRPKADLAGEEQAQIKAALESINVYYLCSGGKGKQRIIACFVGKDDAVLRKAAMEIVITYGRLGAVISRKSSQEAR